MNKHSLFVIAGPCCLHPRNIQDCLQLILSGLITFLRAPVVKSRTGFEDTNDYMGPGWVTYSHNRELLTKISLGLADMNDFKITDILLELQGMLQQADVGYATEIMNALVQLPEIAKAFPNTALYPWLPANNGLGHSAGDIASILSLYGYVNQPVGVKNMKYLGCDPSVADSADFDGTTPMESNWAGSIQYGRHFSPNAHAIYRGVTVDGRGEYRNMYLPELMIRVKRASIARHGREGSAMILDASHICGPGMRQEIVPMILHALDREIVPGVPLVDGIMVEASSWSPTDDGQQLRMDEVMSLLDQVSKKRRILPASEFCSVSGYTYPTLVPGMQVTTTQPLHQAV